MVGGWVCRKVGWTEEPGPMFLSARRAKILALGFTVPATFAGPIYTP